MATTTMPAVFIGHGSPMNTFETNRYTQAWREFGASIPRPRAVLAVSAHWCTRGTAVTAMAAPRTIHDFTGFPEELIAFRYPAPGDGPLAAEVAHLVKPTIATLDLDRWGLDHGTWSVLAHLFPEADVPVVQLSIDETAPFEQHLALGARLAPLRDDGVLIVGSGNVVHNLRMMNWSDAEGGFDWARDFDGAANTLMATDPSKVASLRHNANYPLAAPTPEHFIPLLHLAGLAAAAGTTTRILVEGYAMGSLSMTSHVLDAAA